MIINYGSVNIDYVYQVDEFVRPGETISSTAFSRNLGGKGANQSIAAVRAGAKVVHAGKLGKEGEWIRHLLAGEGIDVSCLLHSDETQGHAIIEVNRHGENSIILLPGSNFDISADDIEKSLAPAMENDILLLQNEISNMPEIIDLAHKKKMRTFFNAAPITMKVNSYPIEKVHTLIINETEGESLTGSPEPGEIISRLRQKYPDLTVILTLGADGLIYSDKIQLLKIPAFKVKCVDSTAAGDTFIGYYAASVEMKMSLKDSLVRASAAAALSVGKKGASNSIPSAEEVDRFMNIDFQVDRFTVQQPHSGVGI